ncbi:hypothetical protein AAFN60_04625 [Roseibacillus persicicus]|uniref:hypothetical protein n=1 Tax=Roseibacillus persicicus TaxID=454148 RepID=UPI00398B66EB
MNRWSLIVKVAGGLVALWIVVYGIKALVAPHQATPERIEELVAEANLEDFSQYGDLPNDEVTRQRRESLEKVASVVNRLDLSGQEEARDTLEGLWDKLSASERRQFVDLTMESFTRFFEALDALTPEARRDFVERGFRELEDGTTERRLEKMMAKDPKIMERIAQNGMKAYFENASAETKMEMAPFLKATNEVMQGIRGQPFQGGGM